MTSHQQRVEFNPYAPAHEYETTDAIRLEPGAISLGLTDLNEITITEALAEHWVVSLSLNGRVIMVRFVGVEVTDSKTHCVALFVPLSDVQLVNSYDQVRIVVDNRGNTTLLCEQIAMVVGVSVDKGTRFKVFGSDENFTVEGYNLYKVGQSVRVTVDGNLVAA